ncbi:MAG: glycosyltransferase [Verrucomicrobiota bacterium]|nr:glycosyltransferase [Verrucomicrobiota bacterium]
MKLWLLSSENPLQPVSGMGRYVQRWATLLSKAGVAVTVIAPGDSNASSKMPDGWVNHTFVTRNQVSPAFDYQSAPDTHGSFPYNMLDYQTALSWQFADEIARLAGANGAPDVIESQECLGIAYYYLQRKLLNADYPVKAPLCMVHHAPDFLRRAANHESVYKFPHYWHGQMEKACIIGADQRVVPSTFLVQQLRDALPGHALEFHTVPLPYELPAQTEPQRNANQVVFIGRLEVCKGVIELVQAFSRIWSAGGETVLDLIGGDTLYAPRGMMLGEFLRRKYQRWIDAGRLRIHGALPFAEAQAIASNATVQVVPSTWENYPYACIEAMAAGRIVLASTSGGQAEMILAEGNQPCGFRFDWGIEGDFEQQLTKALSLATPDAKRVGENARARIQSLCAPEVVVSERMKLYHSLIEGGANKPSRVFPFVNSECHAPPSIKEASQTNTGRVTAVIPYYNMGAFIEETIQSIFASTYTNLEILIVNDGSDDIASQVKLEELRTRYPEKFRVHTTSNHGLAAARYTGASLAIGEFLLFCDADDAIEPTYIAKALHVLNRWDNIHLVYSWERYFGDGHDVWPNWNLEFPYLLGHNLCPSRPVVRRDSFLHAVRNQARTLPYNFEDYEAWIAMLGAGLGGVSLPEILVRYRIRSGSLWQASTRDQQLYLYEQLVRLHPALYQRWGGELFALQNANGPAHTWNRPAGNPPFEDRENAFNHTLGLKNAEINRLKQATLMPVLTTQPLP